MKILTNSHTLPCSYTSIFLPWVQFLRVFGRAPISASIESTKIKTSHIQFQTCSQKWVVIYTFIVQFLWLISVVCFASNTFFASSFPFQLFQLTTFETKYPLSELSPMTSYVAVSIDLTLNAATFIDNIISFVNSSKLARLLNNWNELMTEFNKLQNNLGKANHSHQSPIDFSNVINFRNKFMAFVLGVSTLFGVSVARNILEDTDLNSIAIGVLRAMNLTNGTFYFTLEDGKILLLFKMLEHAFDQILHQAKNTCEFSLVENGCRYNDLSDSAVKQLSALTVQVRKQCQETGKYLTVQMLVSLACILYYSTGALLIVVKGLLYFNKFGTANFMTVFPLVFAVWCFFRYCVIINGASRITEKIQRLHDLLVQSPTEMSLSGYVTLNRKLILGLLSQILTQIIIFLQFDNQ
ncbi:unnamed protein product [Orchesella dallaii]|uniref:Gustatory receptor n=1 Tax=Orchesella dallaii TaxID=48710 RepID=A0ABP1PTC2_9HEXA